MNDLVLADIDTSPSPPGGCAVAGVDLSFPKHAVRASLDVDRGDSQEAYVRIAAWQRPDVRSRTADISGRTADRIRAAVQWVFVRRGSSRRRQVRRACRCRVNSDLR